MTRQARPPVFTYERSGRWAASLRRHGLVERFRLIEVRSLAELDEGLARSSAALVGLELSETSVDRVVEWLAKCKLRPASVITIVFADRQHRRYEMLCREAGAIHFVDSELALVRLAPILDRYLSQAASGTLDDQAASLEERIHARLPWGD